MLSHDSHGGVDRRCGILSDRLSPGQGTDFVQRGADLRDVPARDGGCAAGAVGRLPSEATFSRAFSDRAGDADSDGHLVEHISRDATAIEAREKPAPKAAKPKRRRKRGRPRKGEARAKEPSRLERQLTMSADAADLRLRCRLRVQAARDTADGGIPISCIMTARRMRYVLDRRRPASPPWTKCKTARGARSPSARRRAFRVRAGQWAPQG